MIVGGQGEGLTDKVFLQQGQRQIDGRFLYRFKANRSHGPFVAVLG